MTVRGTIFTRYGQARRLLAALISFALCMCLVGHDHVHAAHLFDPHDAHDMAHHGAGPVQTVGQYDHAHHEHTDDNHRHDGQSELDGSSPFSPQDDHDSHLSLFSDGHIDPGHTCLTFVIPAAYDKPYSPLVTRQTVLPCNDAMHGATGRTLKRPPKLHL